jgi:tRNA threonylcarbamoyladenosine modification (KEOPS) complex Cgi121 subunit
MVAHFLGRKNEDDYIVSKHIYVTGALSRKLKAMARDKQITQQELIGDILEEAAAQWQRNDATKVFGDA